VRVVERGGAEILNIECQRDVKSQWRNVFASPSVCGAGRWNKLVWQI